MSTYRKKPVEVKAFQMTKEHRLSNAEWPSWLHMAWQENRDTEGALQPTFAHGTPEYDDTLTIITLEGAHLVSWGDYIIQGVKGKIYPCKPDIFEMTYELVEVETTDHNG